MKSIFDLKITASGTVKELIQTLKQITARLSDRTIEPEDLELSDLHFPVSVEADLDMWQQSDLLDAQEPDEH